MQAQARWQTRSWTTEDGLPQSTVHAIRQTRDGYLWFATLGGLVRFDGIAFEVIDRATTPGIVSNRFSTIYEDRDATLWAGTEDGVISSLRAGGVHSYRLGAPSNSICAITEGDGALWALTNEGFFRFDGRQFRRGVPPIFASATFTTPFAYGFNQGFAYTTGRGVEIIRPDSRRSVTTSAPVSSRPYTDQQGTVWVAQEDSRLVRIAARGITTIPLKPLPPIGPGQMSAVLQASDGALWLALKGKGIARIAGADIEWITGEHGLVSNSICTLYEDREGSIWAGSDDNGLTSLRRRIVNVVGLNAGLSPPNVYPLVATPAGVLAGTWGGGVYRIANGRAQPAGPRTGWIMSILEEPDGTLWTGTYGAGVIRSKNGDSRVFSLGDGLPNLIVPALFRDRQGRIWAGTHDGLCVLEHDRFRVIPISGQGDWREIHVMAEERDGSLLIGTRAGIGRLTRGNFQVVADERSGLASGNVRAIHLDGDGTLWVGTYDGGLTRIRRGRALAITTREGLYDNGVFSILEQEGFFWMSSNRGIYRVARAELNAVADGALRSVSALALTRRDGLESAECNGGVQSAGCKTADGRLWFPTQRGVVVVEPALLHTASAPPDVVLARAAIDGREMATNAPLRIGAGRRRIELQFASLTFVDAERTRYRYKLEGRDNQWTQMIGDRTVTYTDLPAGRYRFLVSAANAAGQWNARPAALDIIVLPPFWKTWWFTALAVGIVVAILIVAFRMRVQAIENRRAAQAEFSRRLMVQQEEERKRVAAELHDSLGQSLLVIKNRALLAAEGQSDGNGISGELGEISATASTAIDEVRRIAYNLRPAELDHLGVTKAIEALLRRLGAASPILFSSHIDSIDGVLSKEAEVNMFRIVQEWLSNVVRHSRATAAVVSITSEPPRLTIRIRDDGTGFPSKNGGERVGLGIGSIAERARMLGGTSEIVSERGAGTTLTISIDSRSRP